MKNEPKICECCGAKIVEYRFVFNRGLAVFLGRLFDTSGPDKQPVKTDSLKLTYSQRTNSQKLRYWGLAQPVIDANTERKRGWWQITDKGMKFVLGQTTIPKYAYTMRNVITRLDGERIRFLQVSNGYEYRKDYAEQVLRQLQSQQQQLLNV